MRYGRVYTSTGLQLAKFGFKSVWKVTNAFIHAIYLLFTVLSTKWCISVHLGFSRPTGRKLEQRQYKQDVLLLTTIDTWNGIHVLVWVLRESTNVFLILVNEILITEGRLQKLTGEISKMWCSTSMILGYQCKGYEGYRRLLGTCLPYFLLWTL